MRDLPFAQIGLRAIAGGPAISRATYPFAHIGLRAMITDDWWSAILSRPTSARIGLRAIMTDDRWSAILLRPTFAHIGLMP